MYQTFTENLIITDEERMARVNLKENTARTFEMNAIDYLPKPVNPKRLIEVIGKVINR